MPYRNDPQARILPDTNVWLDAIFWPDSVARRALDQLRTLNTPVIIEERIKEEAIKILARRRIALGLSFDPAALFLEFTGHFLHVPPSDFVKVSVNRADQPIARAAIHYHATILSQDARFVAECLDDNILARFPWAQLVLQSTAPPADEILRIVQPSKSIGTIFARVTPGGWLGLSDVGEFTVVDIENLCCVKFDSKSGDWVFTGNDTVRMNFPLASKSQSLICVSYRLPEKGIGQIVVRAYSPILKQGDTKTVSTMKKTNEVPGQIRVGATLDGGACWNGYLRHLTVSPEGLSSAKWKPICALPDAAPNPLNTGILDRGLLAFERRQTQA